MVYWTHTSLGARVSAVSCREPCEARAGTVPVLTGSEGSASLVAVCL